MSASRDDSASDVYYDPLASAASASVNASDPASPTDATYQPRVATIASIVNTMMGTTILALPFGMSQAGVGAGLAVTALVGGVSCATCLIVVERGLEAGEASFAGSVEAHLGRRAQQVAWAFSVAIILGAAIVYHILMGETLFSLVNTVAPAAAAHGWSRAAAALVPWVIFPICALKDLSALVRFNSVGASGAARASSLLRCAGRQRRCNLFFCDD
jgi:amino acid permease